MSDQHQTGPVAQQYGSTPQQLQPPPGGGPSATTPNQAGSLPFSGFDVGLLALAAVGLLGSGWLLRRFSKAA